MPRHCGAPLDDVSAAVTELLPGVLPYASPVDDFQTQRALRRLRDELLRTPNCDVCLHSTEPAERDGEYVWKCPECGSEQASV